ncbi:MAG: cytochrome c3 family protein [Prolixibacteraceae bacterium]
MRLPDSYHNRISYIGTIIASVSLLLIFFVFLISYFLEAGGNYIGLLLYMALPAMLFFGLILIPVGMLIRIRQIKRSVEVLEQSRLTIDFNNPQHRNAAIVFTIGTVVFLILTSIGSYEAIHYTESTKFCGTLCHRVMEPEYVTYQNSAHAHVNCVECHVGAGADYYVKSKLSGLYQVYSVLFKKFPTPIPTPVTSLRPARETCEQCHWPDKFYPNRIRSEIHYLADSANTEWDISYRMKIGPTHSSLGNSEGIHWHINKNVKIEYIEADPTREMLSWVRYINLETGDTTLYQDTESPFDEESIAGAIPRTMDCMDCHNRPSHQYKTPQDYFDNAMAKGDILSDLPEMKKIAMQLLNGVYNDKDTALFRITAGVNEFYNDNYPDVAAERGADIDKSIAGILKAFAENNFPYMKANWDSYPNHLGHVENNGCFRCHDDKHVVDNGRTISKDCNLCHTILQQGTNDNLMNANIDAALVFKHPVDVQGGELEYLCTDCHRYLY